MYTYIYVNISEAASKAKQPRKEGSNLKCLHQRNVRVVAMNDEQQNSIIVWQIGYCKCARTAVTNFEFELVYCLQPCSKTASLFGKSDTANVPELQMCLDSCAIPALALSPRALRITKNMRSQNVSFNNSMQVLLGRP